MKILLLNIAFFFIAFIANSQSITIDESTPFAAVKNGTIQVNLNPPAGMAGPFTVELYEFQEASTPFGPTSNVSLVIREMTNTNSITIPVGDHYTHSQSDGFGGSQKFTHYLRAYFGDPSTNSQYPIFIQNVSKTILGLRNITSAYPSGGTLKIDMLNGLIEEGNVFTVKLFRNGIGTVLNSIYEPGARQGFQTNAINSFRVTLPMGLTDANNYYIEVTSSAPTDGEITNFFIVDNSIPLPVTLINFSAKTTAQGNQLNWETSAETNSQAFDIQRSTDAKKFETIGNIAAKGVSKEKINYEFLDNKISKEATLYYRLKQIDLDGKFEYSKIIVVQSNEIKGNYKVFPNPTNELLNIENKGNKSLNVSLLDGLGRIQKEVKNTSESIIQMHLNGLSKGIYFLQINDGLSINYKKVIKN